MFKFKNYDDYKVQRDAALAEAETALANGENVEEKMQHVKDMDAAWEEFAQKQADINALKGAARAPMSNAAFGAVVDRVNAGAGGQSDDREYRMQFMNYILNGTPIKMQNADQVTTTADVGAVIPQTVVDRIVEKMEQHGNLLNKVTRTYYKGGVAVPISAAKPKATWVAERGKVDKQNKPVTSIIFTYHKLKVVIAVSLTVENVTLEVFERTLGNNIAEAFVSALEEGIVSGKGAAQNQPEGILTIAAVEGQTIIIAANKAVTYKDLCAAEAALPTAYDDAVWLMRKSTFIGQFIGMVDAQGQPIARVSAGLNGKPEYTLLGRHVETTEHMPAYSDTVTEDTTFACLYRLEDYLLNTNLEMKVSKFTDEDTDDECTKAVMLADGKSVDKNSYVPMVKKKATA